VQCSELVYRRIVRDRPPKHTKSPTHLLCTRFQRRLHSVHCVNACVNFEANKIYNSPHLAGRGTGPSKSWLGPQIGESSAIGLRAFDALWLVDPQKKIENLMPPDVRY